MPRKRRLVSTSRRATKYQIDQSGQIEQTNKDTILAVANGKTFSILLKAKDK